MLINKSFANQAGVSLIEILVTTLILGVGLLGVAALQISSLSSNQEGLFASQATAIAEDYASRVRSSKTSTVMPNTNISYAQFVAAYHNGNNAPLACAAAPAQLCRSDAGNAALDCTLAQLAIYDQWEVCSAAQEALPGGLVRVLNNGIRLTIVVDWDSEQGREDIGNVAVRNNNCSPLTGSNTRNCVILELVP
ncbi:type IV pilus modification protein PilV [Aliikangiella marina]|uniref:Type IV pilus modification protein PilV n=1 Tax=Aliikangiella marina TaxID=1712262 RepID=A0A545THX3_9GAMM|nr:type IV pilus modification protein PilV [Aliikangiella marina]TQV76830.1 type IV pilus modification protein PilV [Aliikangiella marina]